MAYWGLALNAWGNPFAGAPSGPALAAGAESAGRAASLPARTRRERGFIAATGALYRDAASTPNAARLQAYADTMATLYRAEHLRCGASGGAAGDRDAAATGYREFLRLMAKADPGRPGIAVAKAFGERREAVEH